MISSRHVVTYGTTQQRWLSDVTDLALVQTAGQWLLCAVNALGGISSYRIADPLAPLVRGLTAGFPAGFTYHAQPSLTVLGGDGSARLLVGGMSGAGVAGLTIDGMGRLGTLGQLFPADRIGARLSASAPLVTEQGQFLVSARPDRLTIEVNRITPDGSLSAVSSADLPRPAGAAGASLDRIATLEVDGQRLVVAISGLGDFISTHAVGADGTLRAGSVRTAAEGTGYHVPSGLEVLQVGGRSFVVVAGNASSSLSVFRLDRTGALTATDHVLDEATTRFQSVTALATAVVDGRGFVIAGGADGGISVFALTPDGRLLHLQTIADTAGTTLDRISAIEAVTIAGKIVLLVTSAGETGVTQLAIDPGAVGSTAMAGSGRVAGTARDDLLVAGSATTGLSGGAGDDILVTGRTGITLSGGAGADILALTRFDGRIVITDYEPGIDRLDLSMLGMIRSTLQLTFAPQAWGTLIVYGNTIVEIRSRDGTPLAPGDFGDEMFPIAHYLLPRLAPVKAADTPLSTTGKWIFGTDGPDQLLGAGAADQIQAGAGNDTVSAGGGGDTVQGQGGNDLLRGGEGADQLLGQAGHDSLFGDGGNDSLWGHEGCDLLYGGLGQDDLRGGTGDDRLYGGAGKDCLYGESGNDTLSGEDDDDLLEDLLGDNHLLGGAGGDSLVAGSGLDSLWGGDGNDLLRGGSGADMLNGGSGQDSLWGGDDGDHLFGEDGNDLLDGGGGSDLLDGGAGDDRLEGGLGNDTLHGQAGNDGLRGGSGADRMCGGAGGDTLWGGAGADGLWGNAGNDRSWGEDGDDLIEDYSGNNLSDGGRGNDRLLAGAGRDTLRGGAEQDLLRGGGGGDLLDGGLGNDSLWGDAGNDRLIDLRGNNLMRGGLGNDSMTAGVGNDRMFGDGGQDSLTGGAGRDALRGGLGNDRLSGQAGNDSLWGDGGADLLYGGTGDDTLTGGAGSDRLRGDAGQDLLLGEAQRDWLWGGAGRDTLAGGGGSDLIWGGADADVFRFVRPGDSAPAAPDIIQDFRAGSDRLDLRGLGLRYIDNGDFSAARQLRWHHASSETRVMADLDGDGRADLVVRLLDQIDLDRGDFLL